MSTISIRLPDSLHRMAKAIASEDHVSINQFIASAVAEKFSALTNETYLKECAQRVPAEKFRAALANGGETRLDRVRGGFYPAGLFQEKGNAMLIKQADDKAGDVETLKALAARPDASADTRRKIDQEIRNIQSGMRGEAEAAYEMGFHYGESKNWMVLHDLRLECGGRTAQIDHLLINRFLEIYVCESKRFSEGVAINEQGEFAAFFGSKPHGIASPLEQNRRHMAVLETVFKTGQVAPPKRLGFTITPSLHGLVLVSKTARISRPKAKIDGIEMVIKNDQLKAKIDRDIDKDNNLLGAAKIVGQDTLEDFARRLAAAHEPIRFDWAAKFGLPAVAPAPVAPVPPVQATPKDQPVAVPAEAPAPAATGEDKKSKLACSTCGTVVAYNIAKFCWFNKPRFGGKVFCMECQKAVPAP